MESNSITCFRCGGNGKIYQYELQLGSSQKCPGCQGHSSLNPNLCIKCNKCKGTGQIYEYDEEIGQKIECPLCQNKGYTTEKYLQCPKCKGDGKIYPFQSDKLGIPKKCHICNALGWVKEKDYNKINLNDNNMNRPMNNNNNIDNYKIHTATQGQLNPQESFIKFREEPDNFDNGYNSGGTSIYEGNLNNNKQNVQNYQNYPNQNNNYNYNNNIQMPGLNGYASGYNPNIPQYPLYPGNNYNNFTQGFY